MSHSSKEKKSLDDAQLLQLAEKELLGEAKRAAVRYSVAGPSGWRPCPLPKANKVFLVNTIRSTISSNRINDKSKNAVPKFRERKMFIGRNSRGHCADNFVFKPPVKKDSKTDSSSKHSAEDVTARTKTSATVAKKPGKQTPVRTNK